MRDYYQTAKEEKRRKRKRKIRIYLFLVLFIAALGGGIWFARSSFFAMRQPEINNPDSSLAQDMLIAFQKDVSERKTFLKTLLGENNIIALQSDKENFTKDLSEKFPAAKNITLDISLISRKVSIHFTERQRFGLWCVPQEENVEHCWWFDTDGVAFLEGPQTSGALINKVIDNSGRPMQTGSRIFDDQRYQTHLIEIFQFLSQSGLNINRLILENRSLGEIQTDHTSYPTIYFSLRISPNFALEPIKKLEPKLESLTYIDLRIENRIYYK